MGWILLLIILFIGLIYAIKLLIFSIKEDIKANARAEAEIRVRQHTDNINLNINEYKNNKSE